MSPLDSAPRSEQPRVGDDIAPIQGAVMSERELTYGEAVKEAIAEEMRRDPRVFLIGEDVAEAGHPFKTLVGLVQEFGTQRIIDTPISEPGYAGIGVGAAMTGMRPIVDVMFGDFITLTMDQMVNQAAKAHYMSGGKIKVPIVFRTTLGATRRSAAQHSQSLHAWVSHVPGLKVALPSGPYEAKGLMKTAIRDDSPVVIFEDKMMYRVKGPVPEGDYTIPFGVAEVKREGKDITLVATSSMVIVALAAAKMLEEVGISAEVIDPRTTWPLDKQALIDSAKKTSRAIVVDEGYERYGVTAEIAAYNGNLHMHRVFGTCATYFPSRADVFLFADYFWQVDNLPFSLVGNVVLRDAPESTRQGAALAREKQARELDEMFAGLGDAGRARACQAFLDANESFKTIAPDAATVLSPLFESRPELRIEKRNADFTVG